MVVPVSAHPLPQNSFDVTYDPDKTVVEFADWGSVTALLRQGAMAAW